MDAICKLDFDVRAKVNEDALAQRKQAEKDKKPTKDIIVPEVGYYDVYGVWFFGKLTEIIQTIGKDKFRVDLNKMMHVYVDIDPKKIDDGIHDITVYGHNCRLYKWMAQGYHRGLVVLTDDEAGNVNAEVYRQSGTWSWVL